MLNFGLLGLSDVQRWDEPSVLCKVPTTHHPVLTLFFPNYAPEKCPSEMPLSL